MVDRVLTTAAALRIRHCFSGYLPALSAVKGSFRTRIILLVSFGGLLLDYCKTIIYFCMAIMPRMDGFAMTDEAQRVATARKQAGQMRFLSEMLAPMLVAAIGLPLIGDLYLTAFEPAPWATALGTPTALAIKLVNYGPAIVAAAAVIALRPVFVEFQEARFVSAKASAAFQHAGILALVGFTLKMLVAPALTALLGGEAFSWRFEMFDIAMMAFASFVLMVGGALDAAAAALKSENDQIV
jgi:hypothetical protein